MDERGKILECYQIGKKGKFSVFVCIQKAQGDIKWKWVCFKRRADYVILIVWLTFEFQSFSVFGKTPSASYFYGFTSIFECFLSSVAFFQSLANWTQSCSTILDIVIIAHMLFTVWTHRNRIKMEKRNHYFVSWTLSESFLRPRDGKKSAEKCKECDDDCVWCALAGAVHTMRATNWMREVSQRNKADLRNGFEVTEDCILNWNYAIKSSTGTIDCLQMHKMLIFSLLD